MKAHPLVTVVCLCYNHASFVEEAVISVFNQTYPNIQVIVVDDASSDNSKEVIQQIVQRFTAINFISLSENRGNCRSFNIALKEAMGEYIIDFATDDIMMPDRVARQVDYFSTLDRSYGVVFTDAVYVNERGDFIRNHYEYMFKKGLLKEVPSGDVYRDVLLRYFIPSPTMMIRREVLDQLKGYDESLSYEDFDFWIRSSRDFKYGFLNEITTMIRKSKGSMSTGLYKKGNMQLFSTYLVCKKAVELNQDAGDRDALLSRLRYELRQSVFSENGNEANLFYSLLKELDGVTRQVKILSGLSRLQLRLNWLRILRLRMRYGNGSISSTT